MNFRKEVTRRSADLQTLPFPRRGPAQMIPYVFHMISFMLNTNFEKLLLDSKEVLSV
jgi:hypothetical protein